MKVSAFISEARREFGDNKKSTRVAREADGSSTLFNTGSFPVIENTLNVYISGATAATPSSNYTSDLDTGDITFQTAPSNTHEVAAQFKYANWRDQNWLEAIGDGIDMLNARGFYKVVERTSKVISAGTMEWTAPSGCVEVFSMLQKQTSAHYNAFGYNWDYRPGSNKFVLGASPGSAVTAVYSYLQQLQKPSATSTTLDVPSAAVGPLKQYAGSRYYRFMAGKIAQQGNATVEEGHLSFTNLRTNASDMLAEFERFTQRAKPTRPARSMQYHIPGRGRT